MVGIRQPLSEAEASGWGVLWKGRKRLGHPGIDHLVFLGRVVGPAIKNVSHAHLVGRIVLHDHRGHRLPVEIRALLDEFFPLRHQLFVNLVLGPQITCQKNLLVTLLPLIGRRRQNALHRVALSDRNNLSLRQSPSINPQVVHLTLPVCTGRPAPDPQRLAGGDGRTQGVCLHLILGEFPIDINLHSGRLMAAIVGQDDVLPRVRLEDFAGDHFQRIGFPCVNDVGSNSATLHPEVEPTIGGLFVHLRKNGSRRFTARFDPTRHCERAVKLNVHSGLKFELRATI